MSASIYTAEGIAELETALADFASGNVTGAVAALESALADFEAAGLIPCFLSGTNLLTPEGDRRAETIVPGDRVIAMVDGVPVTRGVVWTGRTQIDLGKQQNARDHVPVRVKRDAFAPNVPKRDVLITQEHCLFVDGVLIPARMLVNGRSIVYDTSRRIFDVHHIECSQHSILVSDGLPSESYLDTGNRGAFSNADVAVLRTELSLNSDHSAWATDAAAPLAVDRATVEPIWQRLNDRAVALGLVAPTGTASVVHDPELHLLTDAGVALYPTRVEDDVHMFAVPAGTEAVRLVSRASRPSDTIGPFVDDRRILGVKIGEITLVDGHRCDRLTEHLLAGDLSGWHGVEPGVGRWTNGDAMLPVYLTSVETGPVMMEIQIVATGSYLVDRKQSLAA